MCAVIVRVCLGKVKCDSVCVVLIFNLPIPDASAADVVGERHIPGQLSS